MDLPHYVHLEINPECGCEMQNASVRKYRIILGRNVVNSAAFREQNEKKSAIPNQGTKPVLNLTETWFEFNITVVSDSYFSSVTRAQTLFHRKLRYTRVIEMATSQFSIAHLSRIGFAKRMGSYSMT